jgi:glycosyltransferase involved in cell wall biosynthesis
MAGSPKVSVIVQTFNHEAFLQEALDGVLMQRVDFPFELHVGDDCSSDRTREIIGAYERRHPETVKPLLPQAPMGGSGNQLFRALLERADGEYIAVLDGDDFWIHDEKLRRQVAVLDKRTDCSICFHDAVAFCDDGRKPAWNFNAGMEAGRVSMDDLLGAWNIMTTASVLYRNRGLEFYPEWLWETICLDWALHILNARDGGIVFLPERMSTYRIHAGGVWAKMNRVEGLERKLDMLSWLHDCLPSRHLDQLEYARSKIRALIAVERTVPVGDHTVLVIFDGDHQLLDLDGRKGRPFPPPARASDPGSKPADGRAAVASLELAESEGAQFLLIPAASRWWLAHYRELADYLDRSSMRLWADEDAVMYRLGTPPRS